MFTQEDRFNELILQEGSDQGVPPVLIKAVIGTESSFNPSAYREEKLPDGTVWDASYGLMQLLFRTAVSLGFPDNKARYADLLIPSINIHYGTKLLKQLIGRYGYNPKDIYAAYNAGRVMKNSAGQYTNSKGDTAVNARVERFYRIYEYFVKKDSPVTGGAGGFTGEEYHPPKMTVPGLAAVPGTVILLVAAIAILILQD